MAEWKMLGEPGKQFFLSFYEVKCFSAEAELRVSVILI